METATEASYAPRWQANTAYVAGQGVLLPGGLMGTAKVNFSSGATYDAPNWNIPSAGALPSGGTTGQLLAKTSTSATWVDAPVGAGKSFATYDVRDYVQAGETLYTDGSADVAPIIQRAINAANAGYAITGPAVILMPAGRFRINTYLDWKSGVGMRGESMQQTVILPYGSSQAAIYKIGTQAAPVTDCNFSDFTNDGINQTAGKASSSSTACATATSV